MIMDSNWVPGTDLFSDDQRRVLTMFVHRFTKEHRPEWASRKRPDGSDYPVQFESDHEWLARTQFKVKKNGRLDNRVNACRSTPTWPDNPGLRHSLTKRADCHEEG